MLRLLLLATALMSPIGVAAWAQTAIPSTDARLAMLGDYSTALGRRFACNSDEKQMVADIKRFTYGLQLDDDSSTRATTLVKERLTAGMTDVKSNGFACGDAQKGVADLDAKLKQQRALMDQASKTVTAVGGAALACDVPAAKVEALDHAFWTYSMTADPAQYDAKHDEWEKEGTAEVTSKAIDCDQVKAVFGQIEAMFTQ